MCVCVNTESLSHVQFFVTQWSLPGSSNHGIFQARILERIAISFSTGSSQPRAQIHISFLDGGFFTTAPSGKSTYMYV